jgi:ABC-type multidrug transport system permease subunit
MGNTVAFPILNAIFVYWMAGLRAGAAPFFTFLTGFSLNVLVAQSLGLALSVAIRDVRLSLVLAPLITLMCLILGGYYINLARLPAWLHWLPYASFARYAYAGLILNEFANRTFPCAEPGAPLYGAAGGGVCPVAGESVIASLSMTGESLGVNYAVLLGFQGGLRLMAYLLLRADIHIL